MSTMNILIADDEPYITRVLKLVLQKEGYSVTCVNNGLQALEHYNKNRPDLVITDVKMPRMTGNELVEAIRETNADSETPIVVMTSTLENENRDWLCGVSNLTFIGKPVSPRDLIRVIKDCFAQREMPGLESVGIETYE